MNADPHIAYLHCHKLRFEDFGSIQAMLETIREYLRMASEKWSDTDYDKYNRTNPIYTSEREAKKLND